MDKDELKNKLTPEEFHVTQEKGTEAPFSGKFVNHNEKGMYNCKVCGNALFPSDAKLDSSKGPIGLAGWPSFDQTLPGAVKYQEDNSMGMSRTEIVCANCGAHLGHVFDDESEKTGKHFCLNSCALDFENKEE